MARSVHPPLPGSGEGFVAPGFEPVADAFARNFSERGELGAAFAATLDGQPVVDLWGGVADRAAGQRWREDTLQLIFSGTKGLVALCVLMLVDRGRLELERPLADYWPEFAARGKGAITVAEVMSHRGRLPGVRSPLTEADVLDPRRIATLLAQQAPEADPRAAFVYHPLTYGWLCGELVRRIDGRSVGRFLAEEVAAPLGLELWLGLPAELEPRVSMLEYAPAWGAGPAVQPDAFAGDELWAAVWNNPSLFPVGRIPWNERAWHAAEIPGANAIGSARAIARLYGALARGGELDGVRLVASELLARAADPLAEGEDPFFAEPMAYGIGFELQDARRRLGPAAGAFGHSGAGGSIHGAWPQQRIGFSYAMNEMRDDPAGDDRPAALLDALYDCVR